MNSEFKVPNKTSNTPRRYTDGISRQQNYIDLRPKQNKKPPKKLKWLIIPIVILLIIVCTIGGYYLFTRKPAKTSTPNITTNDNAYQIVDDPNGIKFNISKDLAVIEPGELKKMSPFFLYGFNQPGVPNVACIVSQTKRDSPGPVTAQGLRDGTFDEIKKSYPDAQLLASAPIGLKNNHEAVSMDFEYKDNGVSIKQAEIVATTESKTTFAYCSSPAPLFDHYKSIFNEFFSSLEIY